MCVSGRASLHHRKSQEMGLLKTRALRGNLQTWVVLLRRNVCLPIVVVNVSGEPGWSKPAGNW